MPFVDRRAAGRELARLLAPRFHGKDAIVLGLARGGVPVAFEVARALGAPLDVFVARKLGAPHQPEFGIGAIAPGVRVVDARSVALVGASEEDVDAIAREEEAELRRRFVAYRGDERPRDVRGRTVILVDDGLATGVTARAAARSLRAMGPERLVLAVPVAAPDSADALLPEVDELVVAEAHEDFRAVGVWYDDFSQTRDEEVLALLAEAREAASGAGERREVVIPFDGRALRADLTAPPGARGLVVFAHGSGSSRLSPRNRHVAERFHEAGLATLLLDLLTEDEERVDEATRELRFDIGMLAERLVVAVDWARRESGAAPRPALPVGLFGASTGAAAALVAAARRPDDVRAVVSRGGRPDLAGASVLARVRAPTLFVVGGEDREVLRLNQHAFEDLQCERSLRIVEGATHLFEEPGALDETASLAAAWFGRHVTRRAPEASRPGARPPA